MAENISQVIDLGIDLNKLAEDFNKAKALAEDFLATFAKPITIAQNLIDNSALTQNVNKAVETIDKLGKIVTAQFVTPLTEVAPIMEGVTQAVAGTGKAVTTEFQAAGEEIDKTKESLNKLLAQAKAVIDEVTTGEDVDAQKERDKNTAARIKESEQAQDLRSREIAKELEDRARLLEKQADAADAFRSREEAEHLRSEDRKKIVELRINAELLRNAEELANAKRRVAEAKSLATADLRGNRAGTVPDTQVETSLAAVRAAEEAEAQIRKLITQRQEFIAKTQAGALEGEINLAKERISIQQHTTTESIRLSEQANQSILQGRIKVVEEFITLQEREEEERRRFTERQAAINAAELAKQITAEKGQEERIQNDRLKRESDTQVKLRDAIISGREQLATSLTLAETKQGEARVALNAAVEKQIALKAAGERTEIIAAQEKVVIAARTAAETREQIAKKLAADIIKIEQDAATAIALARSGQGEDALKLFNASLKSVTDNFNTSTRSANNLNTEVVKLNNNVKAVESRGTTIERFFGSFGKNLAESAGTIVKFRIGWELTSAAINAALLPATLLVDAIKDGIAFSIELQQKIADIREILVQNVTFSSDLATNFELAGKAAEFLAIEQERSAAKIGVASDKFRSVFESFTQTGGINAVQEIGETTEETLTKATRATALLIAALNSVGVSSKDVRRQTTEIGKLLEGEVTQRDRIRIASGLTVEELNKQSLAAQKSGRFLQFVEGLFAAQVKRIETANTRFTELNTQVQFFRNRLQAAFVAPIFARFIKFLQDTLTLLERNQKQLTEFAEKASVGLVVAADAALQFVKALGSIFSVVVKLVEVFADWFTRLTDVNNQLKELRDAGNELSGIQLVVIGLLRVFNAFANILERIQDDFEILGDEIERIRTGNIGSFFNTQEGAGAEFKQELAEREQLEQQHADQLAALRQEETFRVAKAEELRRKGQIDSANEQIRLARNVITERIDLEKRFDEATQRFEERRQAAEQKVSSFTVDRIRKRGEDAAKARDEALARLLPETAKKQDTALPGFIAESKDRPADDRKELKFNNDKLNALNEQFRTALQTRKNIFEEAIAEIKTAEEERSISEAAASDLIRKELALEGKAASNLAEHYIELANALTESDPKLRAKFAETSRRVVEELQSNTQKAIEKQKKEDAKLSNKLAAEQFTFDKQLVLKQSEETIALAREAASDLRIAKSEAISIELDEEERAHQIRLQINNEQLRAARENAEAIQKALNERFLLEQDHSKKREVLRRNFLDQQRRESLELRRLAVDDAAVQRESLQQQIQFSEQGFTTEQQRLDNQVRLTTAARELAELNLDLAQSELSRLEATSRNTVAIKEQALAVKNLQNAKIEADAAELLSQRRAAQSGFSKLIQGITGVDNAPIKALLDTIGKAIREIEEQQRILFAEGNFAKFEELAGDAADLGEELRKLEEEFKKAKPASIATVVLGIVVDIADGIRNIVAGFQQGALQGISATLGTVAAQVQEPITRAVLGIASVVTGLLGSLFTALARRLAEQIRTAVENIVDKLNDGALSLGNAVAALEAQRLRAIQDLSGKKGGSKELEKLLPELDRQIKSLIKQQQELQKAFRTELNELRLGNDVLGEFSQKWTEINEKVNEFLGSFADVNTDLGPLRDKLADANQQLIDAQNELEQQRQRFGGSLQFDDAGLQPFIDSVNRAQEEVTRLNEQFAEGKALLDAQAEAAEFLSLQIRKIRFDALEELADAEQEAISNALELIDLFEQRKDLIDEMTKAQEDFNRALFDTQNAFAIERRQSGAVRQGQEAARLRKEFEDRKKEFQERLADINREINLKTQIVAKERQVFTLASDRASLQARSDTLTLANIDKMIEKWQALQAIVANTFQNADGSFGINPAFINSLLSGINNLSTTFTTGANSIKEALPQGGTVNVPGFNEVKTSLTSLSQSVDVASERLSQVQVPVSDVVGVDKVETALDDMTRVVENTSSQLSELEVPIPRITGIDDLNAALQTLVRDITATSERLNTEAVNAALESLVVSFNNVTQRLEQVTVPVPEFVGFEDVERTLQLFRGSVFDLTQQLNQVQVPVPEVIGFTDVEEQLNNFTQSVLGLTTRLESLQIPVPEIVGINEVNASLAVLRDAIQDAAGNLQQVQVPVPDLVGFGSVEDSLRLFSLELAQFTERLNQTVISIPPIGGVEELGQSLSNLSEAVVVASLNLDSVRVPVPKLVGLDAVEFALERLTTSVSGAAVRLADVEFTPPIIPSFAGVEESLLTFRLAVDDIVLKLEQVQVPNLDAIGIAQIDVELQNLTRSLSDVTARIQSIQVVAPELQGFDALANSLGILVGSLQAASERIQTIASTFSIAEIIIPPVQGFDRLESNLNAAADSIRATIDKINIIQIPALNTFGTEVNDLTLQMRILGESIQASTEQLSEVLTQGEATTPQLKALDLSKLQLPTSGLQRPTTSTTITIGDINVEINSTSPVLDPQRVGNEVADEIRRRARSGFALV